MITPGPRNLITDVRGIKVGNGEDNAALTGVTVILAEGRAVGAVDVRGGAPGTRETEALQPEGLNVGVDAVVLSGGSVFGLDAAGAVTNWLAHSDRGFKLQGAPMVAPIVPAAILFDLTNGGNKNWGLEPPYRKLAIQACEAASSDFKLGNIGAGFGGRAGAYKGGLGSASVTTGEGFEVGAIVAVNSFGSPVIPGTSTLWAWPFEQKGELGLQVPPKGPLQDLGLPPDIKRPPQPAQNTTIAVIAVNAVLSPAQAKRIAIMAQDGMARALRPIHTPVDGDVVFVMATGERTLREPLPYQLTMLGSLAADCLTRAIGRAVFEAEAMGPWEAYRTVHASGFSQRA
ncbi:MAG: P1 family peptidase [Micropepsaceae bacterium]